MACNGDQSAKGGGYGSN